MREGGAGHTARNLITTRGRETRCRAAEYVVGNAKSWRGTPTQVDLRTRGRSCRQDGGWLGWRARDCQCNVGGMRPAAARLRDDERIIARRRRALSPICERVRPGT